MTIHASTNPELRNSTSERKRVLAATGARMTASLSLSLILIFVLGFASWDQIPSEQADWLRIALVVTASLLIIVGVRGYSYQSISRAMNRNR